MRARLIRPLVTLLSLLLAVPGVVRAQAPDIHQARKTFQAASQKKEVRERQPGVDALVQCRDVRAMDDFITAIDRAEKDLVKLREKIAATGEKMGEAWKGIDKQMGAGRTVYAGSAVGAEKKTKEIQDALEKLSAEQDGLEAWQAALEAGAGRLLDAVDGPARAEWIHSCVSRIEKSTKAEEQIQLLRVIRSSRSDEARDALAGLLSRSPSDALRTAAVDAIGELADLRTVPPLAEALKDESWPVRVAAARALRSFPSVEGIPALLGGLEKAEGRVLEEILQALEDLSGRTFHDNFTLWKEWWDKNEKRLRETFNDLDSPEVLRRSKAMIVVGDDLFLAGARVLLRQEGLGPDLPPSTGAAAAKKPEPPKADDPQVQDRRATLAKVFAGLPKPIRERNVPRLLLRPLDREKDLATRVRYLHLLGPVLLDEVRTLLIRVAGPDPLNDPNALKPYSDADRLTLRRAAVEALGDHPHADVAVALKQVLDLDGQKDLKILAVGSLRRLRDKAAVEPLIRALNDKDAAVAKAAQDALVDVTGEDKGAGYEAWRDWWAGAREAFKPRGAVADAGKTEGPPADPKRGTTFYGIETRSMHLVYILDRSGSMTQTDTKGGTSRIDAAKLELMNSIRSLPDNATFNIVFYNHEFDLWQKTMTQATKENKAAAIAWVKSIEAVGNTNIFDPIERAFELAGRGTHDKAYGIILDTIFLMTDGQPNRGRIISPMEILKEVGRLNELKKVKIHTVGVGEGQDERFLRRMAEITGGTYVRR